MRLWSGQPGCLGPAVMVACKVRGEERGVAWQLSLMGNILLSSDDMEFRFMEGSDVDDGEQHEM